MVRMLFVCLPNAKLKYSFSYKFAISVRPVYIGGSLFQSKEAGEGGWGEERG